MAVRPGPANQNPQPIPHDPTTREYGTMHVPDVEQRDAALRTAAQVKTTRAQIRAAIKNGDRDIRDIILLSLDMPVLEYRALRGVRLRKVLTWQHQWGDRRADLL